MTAVFAALIRRLPTILRGHRLVTRLFASNLVAAANACRRQPARADRAEQEDGDLKTQHQQLDVFR